jgi:hypothetical protein
LRAFQAAIGRELLPIERAAVADGSEGRRRHTVYLRWEASARNERWEADHVELPVLVLPPRASRPCKPWVTLFLDAYSRLVMGWALSPAPGRTPRSALYTRTNDGPGKRGDTRRSGALAHALVTEPRRARPAAQSSAPTRSPTSSLGWARPDLVTLDSRGTTSKHTYRARIPGSRRRTG